MISLFAKTPSIKNLIRSNPFNMVMWGMVLHAIGQTGRVLSSSDIFVILFGTLGWIYILRGLINIKKYKLPFSYSYGGLFIIYQLVVLIMIIRGYMIDYRYQWKSTAGMINFHVFQPTYLLCYLVPFIVLIPRRYYSFSLIAKCATYFAFASIGIAVIFFPLIVRFSSAAATGSWHEEGINSSSFAIYASFSFMALCYKYMDFKNWRWNAIAVFVTLIIVLLGGRRGNSALFALMLYFVGYFYVKSKSQKVQRTYYIIGILILAGLIAFFLNSSMFDYIKHRGLEDNRSGVDLALMSQMNEWEFWFGKGLNGRYYYPLLENDYLKGWRYASETGFFTYILKGGVLMIGLYIMLLLIPAIKGIFNSRNLLCKMGGIYILISLLELYPFGIFTFNVKFCVIWMMVSLCMSKRYRKLTDQEIKYLLFR